MYAYTYFIDDIISQAVYNVGCFNSGDKADIKY